MQHKEHSKQMTIGTWNEFNWRIIAELHRRKQHVGVRLLLSNAPASREIDTWLRQQEDVQYYIDNYVKQHTKVTTINEPYWKCMTIEFNDVIKEAFNSMYPSLLTGIL